MPIYIAPEKRLYIPGLTGKAYYMAADDPTSLVYGFLADEGGPVVSKYADYNTDSVIYHGSVSFAACVTKY